MTNIFIILSWWCFHGYTHMSKLATGFTLNIRSLLCAIYTLVKLFLFVLFHFVKKKKLYRSETAEHQKQR